MTSQKKTRGYLIDDRGTWAVRARIYNSDGTCITRSKSTGLKVKDNTKRKAQAMTDEIISKWEEEQESNNNLFSYYVNKWLESKTNVCDIKQNTAESYKVYINAFIIPLLGDVPISELTSVYCKWSNKPKKSRKIGLFNRFMV